jgi:subtilisin family serine protease
LGIKKFSVVFFLFILLISGVFFSVRVKGAMPSDPLLAQLWGWYRVGADKAFEANVTGSDIVVAVLDSGIDLDHPDLADNIVDGWNFVDNNSDVSDLDNHGSMVSGIIAAIASNGVGLVGVAPEAKIMPLKVIDDDGGNLRDVASAIRFATDNGAKIITMSFSGQYTRFSTSTERAIDYASRQGCILVAAVGNDNSGDLVFPASYDQVIAVSAIDEDDVMADFSNFGSYVDFCAPGVNIVSTGKNGGYFVANGTSFAAPFVSGLVALMLSENPSLSAEEVRANLINYSTDLGEQGWDQYYGWGLVNTNFIEFEDVIPEFPSWIILPLFVSVTIIGALIKKKLEIIKLSKAKSY